MRRTNKKHIATCAMENRPVATSAENGGRNPTAHSARRTISHK